MTEKLTNQFYRGPYILRPDEVAPRALLVLEAPPTQELTNEAKEAVYTAENAIFNREIALGMSVGDIIRARLEDESVSPKFYLDYFKENSDGQSWLKNTLGLDPQTLTASELEEAIIKRLYSARVPQIEWSQVALDSFSFYKETAAPKLVQAYEAGSLEDLDLEANFVQVCVKPQHVIDQITCLRLAKKNLKEQRTSLGQTGGERALRAIIEIYIAKLNSQLAEYMSRLDQIKRQAEVSGDSSLAEKIGPLSLVSYGSLFGDEIKKREFIKRLDYLRNGMGVANGSKNWSSEMDKLLQSQNHQPIERVPAYFTPEQYQKLKSYTLTPEEIMAAVKDILSRLNLLTSDEEISHENIPSDGKVRVVANPNKSSYQYHSKSHSYRAGHNPQNLYEVLTVAIVHEVTHILLGFADERTAEKLAIASAGVQGKRLAYLEEAGANAAQRQAENYLSGTPSEADPVPTYLAALSALERGGSYSDAAKAFYEVKRQRFPEGGKLSHAKEAIDRVARLLRFGINSAPLSYAEEGIIEGLVRSQQLGEGLAALPTCFDLVDQVRLHQFGLLPKATGSDYDVLRTALEVLEPHIKKALEVK